MEDTLKNEIEVNDYILCSRNVGTNTVSVFKVIGMTPTTLKLESIVNIPGLKFRTSIAPAPNRPVVKINLTKALELKEKYEKESV